MPGRRVNRLSFRVFVTSSLYAAKNKDAIDMMTDAGLDVAFSDLARAHSEHELIERAHDADGLLVFNTFDAVTRRAIQSCPKLKVISRHGIGLDNIDTAAAAEHGVIVRNTINAQEDEAVADLAFGLVICCARNILRFSLETKAGAWDRHSSQDVSGKALGIVGLGKIGRAMARRARAFNMEVLAYEPFPDTGFCTEYGVRIVELEELLEQSDFVSLHVPATDSTRGMIGAAELALMKPTAYLINAARAQVVDTSALCDVLASGRIAGAGIDVYDSEPPTANPLLNLDNVIATPHVAAYTEQVIRRMDLEAAENVVLTLNPAAVKSSSTGT